MVYWFWPWSNDWKVRTLHSPVMAVLSLSNAFNPHLLLTTQVYKWIPDRMQNVIVLVVGFSMCSPVKWLPGWNVPKGVEN